VAGEYNGQRIEAGLIIHEGQLTYAEQKLQLIVDLANGGGSHRFAVAAGANVVRKDLGMKRPRSAATTEASIELGLEHRANALQYAQQYGRDLKRRAGGPVRRHYVNDMDA